MGRLDRAKRAADTRGPAVDCRTSPVLVALDRALGGLLKVLWLILIAV
jgi:hypothetical protein